MFRLPKPQKNFTEVPNVVFDKLIPRISNFSALKCYLLMIRKTWGFSKSGDWISISQLIKLTGLSRQSCINGMNWLEENGYIWTCKSGKVGAERKMYFLCSEETEEVEQLFKEGIISADKLYKMMMEEREI
ncbi:MAG: replication protein [Bacilli bacterium]|nr:replication protein [Bacilli bacterium]